MDKLVFTVAAMGGKAALSTSSRASTRYAGIVDAVVTGPSTKKPQSGGPPLGHTGSSLKDGRTTP